MLALTRANLFHLLSLGNKVVATESTINYFSVASANLGSLSKVFSVNRVELIAGFSCICAQFLVWTTEFFKVRAAIVASASWDWCARSWMLYFSGLLHKAAFRQLFDKQFALEWNLS